MEKIDRIIQIIRENMVANAPGTQGGFSGSADPKGPVSGFDPVIGRTGRKYMKGKRKPWIDYLRRNNGRRNQSSDS
jgi:hypothetical protein